MTSIDVVFQLSEIQEFLRFIRFLYMLCMQFTSLSCTVFVFQYAVNSINFLPWSFWLECTIVGQMFENFNSFFALLCHQKTFRTYHAQAIKMKFITEKNESLSKTSSCHSVMIKCPEF